MNTKIHLASVEHLDLVLPLVAAFHKFEEIMLSDSDRKSSVLKLISDRSIGGIWLIYVDEHQLAGYIAICKGYSIEFGGFDAFIDEFYILPEFRRKGIGEKTLMQIRVEAEKLGLRALHLEVAQENKNAKRLYEKFQFKARERYVVLTQHLNI